MPKNGILRAMNSFKLSETEICQVLRNVRSIAIVGLSPNSDRPSFRVAQGMQELGYRIIPVRPKIAAVLGEQAYPDLASVPHTIDLVNVFRAPEHVPGIVDACIALGVKYLWLQDGVIHEEAARRAQAAGITVVMDRCIWRDGGPCGQCSS
jgi:predicted CoA-binding protein